MRIGLISDTHNYFDPKIPELFKNVEHILHGGDIGQSAIIRQLEKIAPVTAVVGNCDSGIPFRETEVVVLGQRKFLVHHIVNVRTADKAFQELLKREQPDVVIFGHTHKPFEQILGKTLYLNPGYAGKHRFSLERSVAILHCTRAALWTEYCKL
jgi:putative phosphoesterase